MQHIIWDWNGTLLNDLPIIIDAVNEMAGEVGMRQITLDDYRTHYTRPVKKFYDGIAGYEIGEDDWVFIDQLFHEKYHAAIEEASLADGAVDVLAWVDRSHHDQSLLSMAPDNELQTALSLFDVKHFFGLAQGNTGAPGGFKKAHLADHLRRLQVDPSTVTMIGDTLDDADAALANGIQCILYDDGSHHRHDLEAVGLPIADTLSDALDMAVGR